MTKFVPASLLPGLLAATTCCLPAQAQPLMDQLKVTDDQGGGVVAEIRLITPDDKALYLGRTQTNGVLPFSPAVECKQFHRLKVKIDTGNFIGTEKDCAGLTAPVTIKVSSWGVLAQLGGAYTRALSSNDTAHQALIAQEIGYRLITVPTADILATATAAKGQNRTVVHETLIREYSARISFDQAEQSRAWGATAIRLAGEKLGVASPVTFDKAQNRWVMSTDMAEQLKTYQKANQLPGAGVLDYRTLRSMSQADIGEQLR